MQKKSQSALEFLTTYGWAFLVILIMIASLNYFGVLDPTRYLPAKCQTSAGVGCLDQHFEETGSVMSMQLVNNFGVPVELSGSQLQVSGAQHCTDAALQADLEISDDLRDAGVGIKSSWILAPNDPWDTEDYLQWDAGEVLQFQVFCQGAGGLLVAGERPTLNFEFEYREAGSDYVKTFAGSVSETVTT